MERRARAFDMAGGMLSTFPWIRYVAPETSGYNLLMKLNNELKDFLTVDVSLTKRIHQTILTTFFIFFFPSSFLLLSFRRLYTITRRTMFLVTRPI